MLLTGDTIAAVATPPGVGAIGAVRISGPAAAAIAERIVRRGKRSRPLDLRAMASHRLVYGRVVHPVTGAEADEVLLAWMRAPNSYTREDTVELFCHGGPVPLQAVLRAVLAAGARAAEPGEFTLRAFLNGRLDLAQAEAVLEVVTARTGEGLQLALAGLGGELAARIAPARAAILALIAYLDAAADFPEDEIPSGDVAGDLATAIAALEETVRASEAGTLYTDGARVAIVGRPNVGKSSLLNALLRADRAIVTPVAGTTRDVIAETINLHGVPVTLLDTAGIAETSDPIEALGIERSRDALASATIALLVLDGSVSPSEPDLDLAARLAATGAGGSGAAPVVVAINKRDLPEWVAQDAVTARLPNCSVVELSTVTGQGLDALERALLDALRGEAAAQSRPALLSARQRAALDRALLHLREAHAAHASGYPIDLLAVDVRAALHEIGQVTGEEVDEAVLTEIFSRFCIGK
jgi:tRNA modification GTPase